MTGRLAMHYRKMNGAMLEPVTPSPPPDDLLLLPTVALLGVPRDVEGVLHAMRQQDLQISSSRLEDLLTRATALGLVKVAGYEAGQARYVATALGQRSARALLTGDPELLIGLEELERLRTELLATVGHELRTPLTAIRTSIGLLLDPGLEPSPEQSQQLLATIGRSADRMQRLLTELLDLARLRAGRVDMDRRRFDARDLLRDVAEALEPMLAAREQRVRLDLPGDSLPVVGDRARLEQAVLNLAANAQKFSPGGAEIALRATHDIDGGVRWTVSDHGPGIGPDERARLFERFFVGTSDRQHPAGGSGLGLPTALAIAQAHGGTIEVDSELGRGSTFHLVLPAA